MSSKDLINLGTAPDSGTGDTARKGGMKINNLFADIYANYGDNPIGNDPDGKNYGYRKAYSEGEYKVGELHPATKFKRVSFKQDSDGATERADGSYDFFHNGEGYFVKDSDGVIYSPSSSTIPSIYLSKEWYFMSRGEQITPDLTQLDSDYFHIVLPLAKAGDRVIIRDSLGHISESTPMSLWATPYEWNSVSQINEWITNTPEAGLAADSDSFPSVNHSRITVPGAASGTNASLRQTQITNSDIVGITGYEKIPFAGTTGYRSNIPVSPITFNTKHIEVECTYLGANTGWVYKQTTITDSGDTNIKQTHDKFHSRDWFQWNKADLNESDSVILQNQYLLPIMSSNGQRITLTDGAPVFKVFQEIGYDSDEFGNKLQDFFSGYVTNNNENITGDGDDNVVTVNVGDSDTIMARKYRRAQIAASNETYPVGVSQSIGNWYNEINIPSIVTKDGILILISNYPFSGRIELFVKGSVG